MKTLRDLMDGKNMSELTEKLQEVESKATAFDVLNSFAFSIYGHYVKDIAASCDLIRGKLQELADRRAKDVVVGPELTWFNALPQVLGYKRCDRCNLVVDGYYEIEHHFARKCVDKYDASFPKERLYAFTEKTGLMTDEPAQTVAEFYAKAVGEFYINSQYEAARTMMAGDCKQPEPEQFPALHQAADYFYRLREELIAARMLSLGEKDSVAFQMIRNILRRQPNPTVTVDDTKPHEGYLRPSRQA